MARSRETKIELTAYDDLFQTDESREEAKLSKIRDIPISEIDEFPDHPFKVLMDEDTMNTFDSMSQIINAGILANKGKKVDSVDIQIMVRCFNQQTYSAAFPKMQSWLNKISQSTEFKYIEAINNRTKHTGDIANKLSMGILGSSNRAEIGPFFRKDIQHGKNELSDQLLATLDFLNDSWDEFQNVFKEEFVRDVYVQNRRHGISGVRQQKLKNEPDKDLSYAYIEANGSFDTMPDELYILLVTEREDDIYAHECPFNTILVTGSSNIDVLGRYKAEDVIGDDGATYQKPVGSPVVLYR